jgi:hypothetical protein
MEGVVVGRVAAAEGSRCRNRCVPWFVGRRPWRRNQQPAVAVAPIAIPVNKLVWEDVIMMVLDLRSLLLKLVDGCWTLSSVVPSLGSGL